MSYIGREPQFGEYIVASSISSLQNGSRTNFPITSGGNPVTIGSVNNTFVSKNGLELYPSDDFVVGGDGTSLTFIVAPAAIDDISIRILGNVFDVLTVGDNTITTTKVQNSAVTDAKLASNSVTTAKILDSNVTSGKLASNSVTTSKIADASVSTNKIIAGSVTTDRLADGSVSTAKIIDGSVTPSKLNSATTALFATAAQGTKADTALQPFTNSSIRVGTSNGAASTNTAIRRFTTTHESLGTDITYADSAANGASFTINTTGVYAISYTDSFGGAAGFGISKNSNQLTTSISVITNAHQLCVGTTAGASYRDNCSTTVVLTAGDVIRPHLDALGSNGAVPTDTRFTITRLR